MKKIGLSIVSLAALIVLFQNFSLVSNVKSPVVLPVQPPTPIPQILGDPPQDSTAFNAAACLVNADTAIPLVTGKVPNYKNSMKGYNELVTSANQVQIDGASNIKILSARRVSIANTSVDACAIADVVAGVSNTSGNVDVAANTIGVIAKVNGDANIVVHKMAQGISNISGDLKVTGGLVRRIVNVDGNIELRNTKVEDIANVQGTIHIYGGSVREIRNTNAEICLHDGARVLQANYNVRRKPQTNCP